MMRTWYEALVVIDREKQISFMNYGYAGLDPNEDSLVLDETDEPNRYAIQMYHHVASAIDLSDKDVVEIGSGRGGGAAYIARQLKPKSMLGIDLSNNAIEFCKQQYSLDRLSFARGDAEAIPLPDNSVDVLINVESSHCYGSMERFLSEVRRILRPGARFLFADHRDREQLPVLRRQFEDARFEIIRETDITANVVRALELDNQRKRELIHSASPRVLWHEAEEFAALVGTRAYESFRTQDSPYVSFVLRTVAGPY